MQANTETVTLEEAKEQVRKVCVRLGLLHMAYARTLVNELGEEKGKRLALKAIREYGIKVGERARKEAGAGGSPRTFKSDLPKYGMIEGTSQSLPLESPGETRRSLGHGCVMCGVWREYGETELGRLYCFVDPVKSMAFDPASVTLHSRLGETSEGEWICEFVTRATTQQERDSFASSENSWDWLDIEPWAGGLGLKKPSRKKQVEK